MRIPNKITAAAFAAAILFLHEGRASADTPENYRTGVTASVEMSTGLVFRGHGIGFPDYSLGMSLGYRSSHLFMVSAGISGINSVNTGTTSLPVFLRLRSDFLDTRVSPFAELEVAYSFQFTPSRNREQAIRTNNTVFGYRLEELGYSDVEAYRQDFLAGYSDPEKAATAWRAELSRLKSFRNGFRDYIAVDGNNIHYGKDGLSVSATIGCSWKVSEHRMDFGVTFGMSQYFEGTCIRTSANEFRRFGFVDALPDGTRVRAAGRPVFKDRFSPEARFRLGFWF